MAQLIFTQQLARFLPVPQVASDAGDLRTALEQAFTGRPRLRSYVLDEQGHLRANVVIFIDGQRTRERQRLDDALQPILRCTFCKPYQEADMSDCAYLATRKDYLNCCARPEHGNCASHFLGDPVSMLLADRRDGTLYAALHLGHFGPKLHRRMAGCSEWTEVAVPAFPVKPADSADPVEWKVLQIWSLAAGGPDQPGVGRNTAGGLFRSDDRRPAGSWWKRCGRCRSAQWMGGGYDVPGIHSICVDPRDSNAVLVGISCGGAWLTTDGGASWRNARRRHARLLICRTGRCAGGAGPHRIVRCAAEPDKLWCQHHNGIWRSLDNGAHWQEVRPHGQLWLRYRRTPAGWQTAWFVPASADSQRIPPRQASP
jgi:hypothetical protein